MYLRTKMSLLITILCVVVLIVLPAIIAIIVIKWPRGLKTINSSFVDPSHETLQLRCAVITTENRTAPYITAHDTNVKNYCLQHGYDYIRLQDCNVNMYWCKIQNIAEYMANYDLIMWLDSDTYITDTSVTIESVVKTDPTKTVYIAQEVHGITNKNIKTLNAGMFIIRCNTKGQEFIQTCMSIYHSQIADCVTPELQLKGAWSGPCYEQGVMNRLLHSSHSQYLCKVPSYVFHSKHTLPSRKLLAKRNWPFVTHLFANGKKLFSQLPL